MSTATSTKPKESNTDFFWRMKEKQDNPIMQLAGGLAFFFIISAINRNWLAGLAFMLSMFFHELGHLLFFLKYGIDAHIRFIFPLGMAAAAKTKEENARSDLLPWWEVSNILQAGPFMNTIQMAIGVCLVYLNIWPEFGYQVIFVNGMLGLFNLLPLGNMDGGQLFHVIFSSLKKTYDIAFTLIVLSITLATTYFIVEPSLTYGGWGIASSLWQNVGWWPFLILFAAGLAHKQGRDNDEYWKSSQAMTPVQIGIQFGLYVSNIVAMLWLFSI